MLNFLADIAKGKVPLCTELPAIAIPILMPVFPCMAWTEYRHPVWTSLEHLPACKSGGWSGWINYTSCREQSGGERRSPLTDERTGGVASMQGCGCGLCSEGTCTRLSKGIQLTVKQEGRSHSLSLPIQDALGVHICGFWTHPQWHREEVRSWEWTLVPGSSCLIGSAAQEPTCHRCTGTSLWASFQSVHTPGAHLVPCHVVSKVLRRDGGNGVQDTLCYESRREGHDCKMGL